MLFVILLKIYKNIYKTNVTTKKESAQIRTLSNTLLQLIFVRFLCNFKMHRVLGAKVLQEVQEQLLLPYRYRYIFCQIFLRFSFFF